MRRVAIGIVMLSLWAPPALAGSEQEAAEPPIPLAAQSRAAALAPDAPTVIVVRTTRVILDEQRRRGLATVPGVIAGAEASRIFAGDGEALARGRR